MKVKKTLTIKCFPFSTFRLKYTLEVIQPFLTLYSFSLVVCHGGGSFFAISHFTTLRGTWRGVLNQGGWEIYAKLRENDIAPEKKHSSHLTILKMQHSHQITQYSTHSSIQATTSKSMNRLSASAMEPNKILRSNTFI